MRVRITGTGLWVPPRVETAEDIALRIGRTPEWVAQATGVARRHVSDDPMDVMAARVGREALGAGGPPDLIINASLTPLQLIPDSSVFIQRALGYEGIPSFSIHATCLSFLVALQNASALVSTGAYRRVLVISAEQGSVCRDFDDPESASLIGDGAAAAVIERTPEGESSELLAFAMSTWPEGAEYAQIIGCGTRHLPYSPGSTPKDHLFHMVGARLYRLAAVKLERLTYELLARAGVSWEDVTVVVPHQASGPALEAVYRRVKVPRERVIDLVGEYGNCIAASIPMGLAHAERAGRLKRGDIVLILGLGAGLSCASALLRW